MPGRKKRDMNGKHRQNLDSRTRFQRMHQAVDEDFMRVVYNDSAQKVRHKKKLRKLNERFHHHHHHHGTHKSTTKINELRQATPTIEPTLATESIKPIDPTNFMEPVRAFAENLTRSPIEFSLRDNRTMILLNTTVLPTAGRQLIKRIAGPDHCYNTNEVLEIIAVTCLVNFIFWFVIISCVNYYTKKEKVKYATWETVESAELLPEYEVRFENDKSYYPDTLPQTFSVFDYVDETTNGLYIPEPLNSGYVSAYEERECCPRHCPIDEDRIKWAILNGEALGDHLPRLKDWKARRMNFGASSHSMENLIF